MDSRQDVRLAAWSTRFAAMAPVTVLLALVVAFLGPRSGPDPVAAAALALAFVGAGFGLGGLFLGALASEKVPGFVRPRWAVPCAIGGIAGGFLVGLLASVRGIVS